ncbi:MAG: hypothetical protein ACK55I_36935, partial [bacterium]
MRSGGFLKSVGQAGSTDLLWATDASFPCSGCSRRGRRTSGSQLRVIRCHFRLGGGLWPDPIAAIQNSGQIENGRARHAEWIASVI